MQQITVRRIGIKLVINPFKGKAIDPFFERRKSISTVSKPHPSFLVKEKKDHYFAKVFYPLLEN